VGRSCYLPPPTSHHLLRPNGETRIVFHCRFGFVYAADLSPARSLPQQASQFGELGLSSRCVNFYAVVIQIADVSSNAQGVRGVVNEIAEADPLDSSTNPIELCYFCGHSTRFIAEGVGDDFPELDRPSIALQQNRSRIGFVGVQGDRCGSIYGLLVDDTNPVEHHCDLAAN
jgi:hypothetical protein